MDSVPLLAALGTYGNHGKSARIRGSEIGNLLFREKQIKYKTLLDFIPDLNTPAIQEPQINETIPLTHHRLKIFIENEFNLETYGLKPHSRIAVLLPNGPILATCLIAILTKWCAAPINPTSTKHEIIAELQSTKAKAIIILAGAHINEAAIEAAETLNVGVLVLNPLGSVSGLFRLSSLVSIPNTALNYGTIVKPVPGTCAFFDHPEISLLLHTSGTSGNKKLVPYSLDMIVIGVSCIISSWNLQPTDVCLNMMPLFHIGGIMRNILSPILSGGSVITCSGFDPLLFWDILSGQKVTWYYAAPTMHHAILQEAENRPKPLPVQTVRYIANAAGGLLPVLAQSLQQTFNGCTILTSYGMTECMPISSPPQNYKLYPVGTSGIAVGPDILIVDGECTKSLAADESGNILVRGFPCFCGYENDDSANMEAFLTINDEPGWFNTGDVGRIDKEGYLYISGRSKEIINRGGETISPFEIEEAVVQHPAIKEALAFSAPHAEFQETVGMVVVIKAGYKRIDIPSLHCFLDDKLHRSKWPQVIIFMDSLPKNAANKILRIKLADRTKMEDIDEDSSPLSRLYDAQCPPTGSSLTLAIPIMRVSIDASITETFLKQQDDVQQAVAICLDLPFHQDTNVAFVTLSTRFVDKLLEEQKCVELQMKCDLNLHRYLSPSYVYSLPSIPMTKNKIDYDLLNITALRLYRERNMIGPRNTTEIQIERVWREQLGASSVVSVVDSFFDLGGDSLKAGQLISAIRKQMRVHLSVADLFTAPTIETLSHKILSMKTLGSPSLNSAKADGSKKINSSNRLSSKTSTSKDEESADKLFLKFDFMPHLSNTSLTCLLAQSLPVLVIFPFRAVIIWFFVAIPWVEFMKEGMGRLHALICAMIMSRLLMGILCPLMGIAAKWLLIGKYRAGRYPLWGNMYLRWWIVGQIVNIMGKGFFRDDLPIIGPDLVRYYYILMGATIGSNVKIHKDAIIGCADLLTIGDNVIIDKASVNPFSLEEGHFVLLPIIIGHRCSIGVKSSIAAGSHILSGSCVGPLSSSHEVDEAEAHYKGYCRPGFQSPPPYLIILVGIPILALVTSVGLIPWYFGLKIMVAHAKSGGWYERDIHTVFHAFMWWIKPQRLFYYFLIRIIRRCLVPFFRLAVIILLKKFIIGEFKESDAQEKLKPWNLFRYWLMSKLLPGGGLGGVAKLVGTHYEIISIVYRLLGAKVGKHVYWPGSGLDIVEYDLLDVGSDVVFGSRSVVMTSSATRSARVIFEDGAMIADRCVILPGTRVRRGAVLGSGSLACEDMDVPVGSIWVGSREGCAVNASPADLSYNVKDTTTPFARAFYLGQASYRIIPLWGIVIYNMFWQAICTCLRHSPTALSLILCSVIMKFDEIQYSAYELFKYSIIAFSPIHLALCLFVLLIDITGKWILLGRRKAGAYPWDDSSYCQRWQMYLTLQEIRRSERRKNGILDMIQGSQYLVWYFSLLGGNIGRNVCLYPSGADPMMTEPDLVTIEDSVSIDDASLIAHINTRGVFRLNPLFIGKGCVLKSMTRLLSGAAMEKHSILLEHTLVLAGENVDIGSVWQGWPSSTTFTLSAHRDMVTKAVDAEARRIHNEENDRRTPVEKSNKSGISVNFKVSSDVLINSIDSMVQKTILNSENGNERTPLIGFNGKSTYSGKSFEIT